MEIYGEKAHEATRWLHCHQCNNRTIHTLQYAEWYAEYEDQHEDGTPWEYGDTFLIWRCNGCLTLTLEDAITELDFFGGDENARADYKDSHYYPNLGENVIRRRYFGIPKKIQRIYYETIDAFNNNLNILCATGLRGLIEGICDDKEISGKHDNLEKKIKSLTKAGIPANMTENLHSFRFMGNTAIHELTSPKREELRLAIEIIEDLLNYLYDLDYKLKRLSTSQKQRPKFIVRGVS